MSEVTFAKSFLATLDKRAIKLSPDHVSDPRKYPNQSPYVLPRQTHPFPRRTGPTRSQTAASKTLTATLKPMRAGEVVELAGITLDTTVHDLKCQYAAKTGLSQDKIKLLLNKKPTPDLKTLKDLAVEGDVEFSVMVMGGGGAGTTPVTTPKVGSPAVEKKDPVVELSAAQAGEKIEVDEKGSAPESEKAAVENEKMSGMENTANEILGTSEFWDDLKGFLSQRLRDEKESEKLVGVFQKAWNTR